MELSLSRKGWRAESTESKHPEWYQEVPGGPAPAGARHGSSPVSPGRSPLLSIQKHCPSRIEAPYFQPEVGYFHSRSPLLRVRSRVLLSRKPPASRQRSGTSVAEVLFFAPEVGCFCCGSPLLLSRKSPAFVAEAPCFSFRSSLLWPRSPVLRLWKSPASRLRSGASAPEGGGPGGLQHELLDRCLLLHLLTSEASFGQIRRRQPVPLPPIGAADRSLLQ